MWLLLAFLSATLLGFYDSFKKAALRDNPVVPVLLLNTLFCSLIFLPFIVLSATTTVLDGTPFHVASGGWSEHRYIILKSLIVLSSWVCGYVGMKHLPLTIVGPINATRPVMVLVGAMLVFGERLNVYQWIGVLLAVVSFFMLSRSGKKEGIDFKHDRWIWFIVLAALLGAVSGLYDKFLMAPRGSGGVGLDRMLVQSWYNIYQCVLMAGVFMVTRYQSNKGQRHEATFLKRSGERTRNQNGKVTPFRWTWSIVLVSVFLSAADFMYFYALSLPDAMISVVSMIRRGSVVVSFLVAAVVFHEKNLRSKAVDLALVLLGLFFLFIGSR